MGWTMNDTRQRCCRLLDGTEGGNGDDTEGGNGDSARAAMETAQWAAMETARGDGNGSCRMGWTMGMDGVALTTQQTGRRKQWVQ